MRYNWIVLWRSIMVVLMLVVSRITFCLSHPSKPSSSSSYIIGHNNKSLSCHMWLNIPWYTIDQKSDENRDDMDDSTRKIHNNYNNIRTNENILTSTKMNIARKASQMKRMIWSRSNITDIIISSRRNNPILNQFSNKLKNSTNNNRILSLFTTTANKNQTQTQNNDMIIAQTLDHDECDNNSSLVKHWYCIFCQQKEIVSVYVTKCWETIVPIIPITKVIVDRFHNITNHTKENIFDNNNALLIENYVSFITSRFPITDVMYDFHSIFYSSYNQTKSSLLHKHIPLFQKKYLDPSIKDITLLANWMEVQLLSLKSQTIINDHDTELLILFGVPYRDPQFKHTNMIIHNNKKINNINKNNNNGVRDTKIPSFRFSIIYYAIKNAWTEFLYVVWIQIVRLIVRLGLERHVFMLLPMEGLLWILNASTHHRTRPHIVRVITMELDRRFKVMVSSSNNNYNEITIKKWKDKKEYERIIRKSKNIIVKQFLGKNSYTFGDISRKVLKQQLNMIDDTALKMTNTSSRMLNKSKKYVQDILQEIRTLDRLLLLSKNK